MTKCYLIPCSPDNWNKAEKILSAQTKLCSCFTPFQWTQAETPPFPLLEYVLHHYLDQYHPLFPVILLLLFLLHSSFFLIQNCPFNTFRNVKKHSYVFVNLLALIHTTNQSFLLFKLDEIIMIHKLCLERLWNTLL